MNTPQSLYAFTSKLILGKSGSIIIFPVWGTAVAFYCSLEHQTLSVAYPLPLPSHPTFPDAQPFFGFLEHTKLTPTLGHFLLPLPGPLHPRMLASLSPFYLNFLEGPLITADPLTTQSKLAPFPLIRSHSPVFFSSMYFS